MSPEDFDEYVRSIGYKVELQQGTDGNVYTVVLGLRIPNGTLAGRVCDVGVLRPTGTPYVMPAAIHTRPALVPMDMQGPIKTQASPLGSDWQYWSRRLDRVPTPQVIWTHILTVLTSV